MSHHINQFQLMAKPSGSVCNIDCTYCYYLEKRRLYPQQQARWKMDGATLENYVRKNIASQPGQTVHFHWQGGEPTLLGIDFFREALRLQERYRSGKRIDNVFQTNGIKLDDDWARFLKQHGFLVGLSLDGDRLSNDAYRLTRGGKSTFDAVIRGLEALKRHNVDFNTLTVVNAENVKRPQEIYRFLKRIGSRYMQFIPLVERRAAQPDANGLTLISPDFSAQCRVTEWSVPAKAYGRFLNVIFDSWVQNDVGSAFVMNFEQTLAKIAGRSGSCVMSETCGDNPIVESNGDIYSCDHFVYPEHKLGNINHDSLSALVNSAQNIAFAQRKRTNIGRECLNCSLRPVCNGGCPKHRFMLSDDGRPNKNYFCDGYMLHLRHVLPIMQTLLTLMQQGLAPERVGKTLAQHYYRQSGGAKGGD